MQGMDVTIVEVSPRDGLQNESVVLSTDAKVELVTRLVRAGARRVEAVSFAHPKLVPAMADAEAVMERLPRTDGVAYAGLVLNRRGLDRALGSGVDEVNVVVGVSDTFSRRNQRSSTEESMQAAADVIARARDLAERCVAADPGLADAGLADTVALMERQAAGDWLERT
jgi:hydroxymethylglutaryl-CoA lyase